MKTRRVIGFLLSLCLIVGISASYLPVQAAEEIVIHILHTNDVHGRFYQVDSNNAGMIGIDKIAAIRQSYENVILVDVGDAIHGLPIVNINEGVNAALLMLAAGYDVMVPGNHDFNWGSDTLAAFAETALEYDLHIISANIYDTVFEESFLPATTIIEVAGVKVGFFGLTTLTTPYVTHPMNVATLEFLDYVTSAEAAIEELIDEGADIIVMMAHVTRENPVEVDILDILEALTVKPDLVIDGHDHLASSKEVDGIVIAGAGSYQANLGIITLTIDTEGQLSVEAVLLTKDETADIEPDENVQAIAEEMKEEVLAIFSEVVAASEVLLSSARGDAENAGVRNSEQPLGNLVADAMRFYGEADVALTNGGGLRADIKVGEITVGDINSVLPFGNVLVVKEATPKGLKDAMEVGLAIAPAPLGGFPQISGMSVVYDPAMEAGNRVVSITIDGEELDLADTTTIYTLATNDFMAAGGDGYGPLAEMPTLAEIESLDTVLEFYIVNVLDGVITEDDAVIEGRIEIAVPDSGPSRLPIIMSIDSLTVSQGRMLLAEPPVAPQIINDRTMLPFRYLVQTVLQGEVEFDPETYIITATLGDHEVIMIVGETEIKVDGEAFDYGQAPVIVDGHTLVPLRAFASILTDLEWDAENRVVTLYP
ncbi:MAG: 5'-nucleotidase C-terminal domain-containing protein [Symbiobacteriaceae bacterium]|nr:5'-nucleotidase C-terminal domain-containing protein [Symbiobacteriaceae bacterium]